MPQLRPVKGNVVIRTPGSERGRDPAYANVDPDAIAALADDVDGEGAAERVARRSADIDAPGASTRPEPPPYMDDGINAREFLADKIRERRVEQAEEFPEGVELAADAAGDSDDDGDDDDAAAERVERRAAPADDPVIDLQLDDGTVEQVPLSELKKRAAAPKTAGLDPEAVRRLVAEEVARGAPKTEAAAEEEAPPVDAAADKRKALREAVKVAVRELQMGDEDTAADKLLATMETVIGNGASERVDPDQIREQVRADLRQEVLETEVTKENTGAFQGYLLKNPAIIDNEMAMRDFLGRVGVEMTKDFEATGMTREDINLMFAHGIEVVQFNHGLLRRDPRYASKMRSADSVIAAAGKGTIGQLKAMGVPVGGQRQESPGGDRAARKLKIANLRPSSSGTRRDAAGRFETARPPGEDIGSNRKNAVAERRAEQRRH